MLPAVHVINDSLKYLSHYTLQQLFPYKSSYSFQSSDCHKISFFNDGGLKLGHFDIFGMLSPFLVFVKL